MATGNRLEGKVVIVTGGGTGIGEAICKKFAREGASIVVCGFEDDPVEDVAETIRNTSGSAICYSGDISRKANAKECIEKTIEEFGRIDVLINNAGVFPVMDETQDYPIEAFEFMMFNNVWSTFLMTKYALPELQKTKGCVVSAGSEAGLLGLAKNTPYGGTKAWIHAFTRGLAVEQAKYGVRCNCVCPGPIDTAWTHKETGPMDKKMEEMLLKATPMARRGTPEEVANVYLFLASDEASYVTGALFSVDGGITIAKGSVGEEVSGSIKEQPKGELDLEHSMDGNKGGKSRWI